MCSLKIALSAPKFDRLSVKFEKNKQKFPGFLETHSQTCRFQPVTNNDGIKKSTMSSIVQCLC